jgi:hypothetical protein
MKMAGELGQSPTDRRRVTVRLGALALGDDNAASEIGYIDVPDLAWRPVALIRASAMVEFVTAPMRLMPISA